jgi:hypothetical protein
MVADSIRYLCLGVGAELPTYFCIVNISLYQRRGALYPGRKAVRQHP